MIEASGVDHVVLQVDDVERSKLSARPGRDLDGHRLQLMVRR